MANSQPKKRRGAMMMRSLIRAAAAGCLLLQMVFACGCGPRHSSNAPAGSSPAAVNPVDAATAEGLMRRAEELVGKALAEDRVAAERLGAVRGTTIDTIQVFPRGYAIPFGAAEHPPSFIISGTMQFEHAASSVTVVASRKLFSGEDSSVQFFPIGWLGRKEAPSVDVQLVDPQLQFASP
jgi:hypothetical protein